jgi:hypothetical protein
MDIHCIRRGLALQQMRQRPVRKDALGAGMVAVGGRLDHLTPRSQGAGPWFAAVLKGSQSAPSLHCNINDSLIAWVQHVDQGKSILECYINEVSPGIRRLMCPFTFLDDNQRNDSC